MSEKTYVVIDTNLVTNDMITESIGNETSFRKSLDETKSILKFNYMYPNTMVAYTKYTNAEIIQYLVTNKADWEATGPQ